MHPAIAHRNSPGLRSGKSDQGVERNRTSCTGGGDFLYTVEHVFMVSSGTVRPDRRRFVVLVLGDRAGDKAAAREAGRSVFIKLSKTIYVQAEVRALFAAPIVYEEKQERA